MANIETYTISYNILRVWETQKKNKKEVNCLILIFKLNSENSLNILTEKKLSYKYLNMSEQSGLVEIPQTITDLLKDQ